MTTVIPNACYYRIKLIQNTTETSEKKNSYAHIYSSDGLLIKSIALTEDEIYTEDYKRINAMLDPLSKNKLHSGKFVITGDNILGLYPVLHVYDRNDIEIVSQRYNGPNSLEELVAYQKANKYAVKIDYEWALENKIPVINNYKEKTCLLNCMHIFKCFGCL